jgi:DNA-binding CsgD family transcriptional regulator
MAMRNQCSTTGRRGRPEMIVERDWPLIGRDDELAEFRRVLANPDAHGLLVAGAAGLGKTRIAAEYATIATGAGCRVVTVSGHRSRSDLPFGAVAHLLPDVGRDTVAADRGALLRRLAAALSSPADGRRLVLVLDDAHLLDDSSATLVYQMAVADSVGVVATIRAGEAAPDAVLALWKDGLLKRRDLVGLSFDAVGDLLSTVLGGPVDPALTRTLATRCDGNVLFLRELVIGARADGALRMADGMWRVVRPLHPSHRLVELVEARLAGLSGQERRLLELVSFGEPLGQAELETLGDLAIAERLERAGLLRVRLHHGRLEARLGHPVYGDVLRAGLSAERVAAMARALAEAVESAGLRRTDELLRIGGWRLVGGGGSPALMVAAAVEARWRYDFALAERLVAAAQERGAGFDADLLAAKLLGIQGRSEQAEDVLALLASTATDDRQRGLVTIARMDNFLYASRSTDSLQVAAEAERSMADPGRRNEIAARRAALMVTVAGPRATLEAIAPLLAGTDTGSGAAQVWACLAGAHSLARMGRCHEAMAITERGHRAHVALGEPMEWYPWFHLFNRSEALLSMGRLGDAEAVARREYETGLAETSPEAQACFALQLAKVNLARGRVRTAAAHAREAIGVFRRIGRPMFLREALSCLRIAYAHLSEPPTDALLEELDAMAEPPMSYGAVNVLRAGSWSAVSDGQVARACQLAADAADLGIDTGDLVAASAALHDLARFGRAVDAVSLLDQVAAQVGPGLIGLRAVHVRALATGDADGLERACTSFSDIGADLVAAEAAVQAAAAWNGLGRRRAGSAATQLAIRLHTACEGAVTPALASIDEGVRLTFAERRTAALAAEGRSNKSIAAELRLSVRTVEHRLQRVYTKTGTTGRSELAGVLDALVRWRDEDRDQTQSDIT